MLVIIFYEIYCNLYFNHYIHYRIHHINLVINFQINKTKNISSSCIFARLQYYIHIQRIYYTLNKKVIADYNFYILCLLFTFIFWHQTLSINDHFYNVIKDVDDIVFEKLLFNFFQKKKWTSFHHQSTLAIFYK